MSAFKNIDAVIINKRLGAEIFNVHNLDGLKMNAFTKKQILNSHLDDLICPKTKRGTDRLAGLVKEIKEAIQRKFDFEFLCTTCGFFNMYNNGSERAETHECDKCSSKLF